MTSDSDRKAAYYAPLRYAEERFGTGSDKIYVAATSYHDGRSSALKELEQVAREAFEAARSEVPAKTGNWHDKHFSDIEFPTFTDYWQQRSKGEK